MIRIINSGLTIRVLVLSCLWVLAIPVGVSSQSDDTTVQVSFYSAQDTSLSDLLIGKVGEGWLLYYLSGDSLQFPKLIVHLSKADGNSPAIATIYHASDLPEPFHISNQNDFSELGEILSPSLIIKSVDGWWVKENVTNYNLDIQVNGSIYAMWGAGYDQEHGPQGWAAEISPGQPAVNITVRDTNGDGLPDWEMRHLIPEFPGRGYINVNYAERKCPSPVKIDLGLFPDWPFVAGSGGFEQQPRQFRPPIVVDWESGKITNFSELVSVRNQNCSYSLYSLNRIQRDALNRLNFETPFATYDLSSQGRGYPNLILRTERYPKGDIRFGRSPHDFEHIRYSWRNEIGDWNWDYKIEVAGSFSFNSTTLIAGGQYHIDTPSYEDFPYWVISHAWPVVTFIDSEGSSYRSSEGIYEWSPRSLGDSYFQGKTEQFDLSGFKVIRQGFRGEYRINNPSPSLLYFSPIDNRLHLLGADGGLWNLGGDLQMRLDNLTGRQYLDTWLLEVQSIPAEGDQAGIVPEPARVLESLHQLGSYLLYIRKGQVAVAETDLPVSIFEILPPINHKRWQAFRDQVDPLTANRRDPLKMYKWLEAAGNPLFYLDGAQVRDLRSNNDGYRFVLEISTDAVLTGEDRWGLALLTPGTYLVELTPQEVNIRELTPAALILELKLQHTNSIQSTILVHIENSGLADMHSVQLAVEQHCSNNHEKIATQRIDLYADETKLLLLSLPPQVEPNCTLIAWLEDEHGELQKIEALALPKQVDDSIHLKTVLQASSGGSSHNPVFLLLVAVSILAAALVAGLLAIHKGK
jgi:hypothetical protein